MDTVLEPVHSGCLRTWRDERTEKLENKVHNGGLLRGFLGGLLGGAVAVIPSMLTIYFTNTMYALLYALIPLGIYYGWSLAGGKRSALTTVFSVLYSLVLVFVILFVYTYIELSSFATVSAVLRFMLDPEIFREFYLEDAIFGLIFVAIGIVGGWRQITKTDAGEIVETEEIMRQVVPITTPAREPVPTAPPVQE